jgi:hypothetical protein
MGVSDTAIPFSCSDPGSWDQAFLGDHSAMGLAAGAPDSRCFSLRGDVACAKGAKPGQRPVCTDSTFLCARAKCSAKGDAILMVRLAGGETAEVLCNKGEQLVAQGRGCPWVHSYP